MGQVRSSTRLWNIKKAKSEKSRKTHLFEKTEDEFKKMVNDPKQKKVKN